MCGKRVRVVSPGNLSKIEPPERKVSDAGVDRYQLSAVAREYLRPFPPTLQWRFDVVTVYYDKRSTSPKFQLFQNALPASY
jgi:hypothetical protein